MSNDDVSGFLFGGGGKAFKFDDLGDVAEGEITDVQVTQQTDMDTQAPLFWSDGSPRKQLVITLQTSQKDDDNDDGQRRLYAKGGNFEAAQGEGKSMKDAVADAVKKSGARSIASGGYLKVAFTGLAKKTNRGFQPAKLYKASYKQPVASVSADELFDDG